MPSLVNDASGRDVLGADEYFVIAGDRIWFLRPRGFSAAEVGIAGEIVSGELRQSPGGSVRVVDGRSGAVLRENLRL